MIGLIRGIILEKQPPLLLIEVQGIGYEIDASMSTFNRLPDIGQTVQLYTHFVVREDAQHLYGFYTKEERVLFKSILKVNGIGPKLALSVLSNLAPAELGRCIITNEVATLIKIPGVGKKTAERLIIEMRDKVTEWHSFAEVKLASSDAGVITPTNNRHQTIQDAVSALISLGYKPQEASRVVSKVDDGVGSSEFIIRQALQERIA